MGLKDICFSCVWPCCFGQQRYVMVAIGFFSIIVTHCQRTVLSIAIVEMVGSENETTKSTCPNPRGVPVVIENIGGGKVDWNEKQQNLNLASFYIGYFVMHVPAGIICDIYGGRHPLIWGTFVSTVTTALMPMFVIYFNWWSVIILRVIMGLGQSMQYPALSNLVMKWIPSNERSTASSIVFASNSLGYVFAQLISGLLISLFESWTVPFYGWTLVGIIFHILSLVYLFSEPKTHPFINETELQFLDEIILPEERKKVPVYPMAKDKCVYGLLIGQIGHDLIMFTFANNLPKYLNNVLGMDIKANSLFSFVYLGQLISAFGFGVVSDIMINNNVSVRFTRHFFTDISLVVASTSLLGVAYVGCNVTLVIVLLMVSMFFNGLYYCGLKVHVIEVSFCHAGLLMAMVNGIGSLSGFFSSTVIGVVAKDNTHEQWIRVFYMLVSTCVFAMIVYTVTTDAERRPWDYHNGEKPKNERRNAKCYLELTPSSHEMRKQEMAKAKLEHAENVRAAKEKAKG